MCLAEIVKMCSDAKLYDDNFYERDAIVSFGLAMQTEVDELYHSQEHYKLRMIEFYEVLGRIAEIYSALPIGDEFEEMVSHINHK